jgi:uncharacterized integral membrane protein
MNKKGVTWSVIIYGIIAIIVLITLVWIFREQMNEVYKGITTVFKPAVAGTEEASKAIEELVKQ